MKKTVMIVIILLVVFATYSILQKAGKKSPVEDMKQSDLADQVERPDDVTDKIDSAPLMETIKRTVEGTADETGGTLIEEAPVEAEEKTVSRPDSPDSLIYTIQAGSFKGLESARGKYNSIIETLDKEDLDYLRIEKVGEHYAVRIGKFEDRMDAGMFHESISPLLKDTLLMKAFIKDERIKSMYADPSDVLPEKLTIKGEDVKVTDKPEVVKMEEPPLVEPVQAIPEEEEIAILPEEEERIEAVAPPVEAEEIAEAIPEEEEIAILPEEEERIEAVAPPVEAEEIAEAIPEEEEIAILPEEEERIEAVAPPVEAEEIAEAIPEEEEIAILPEEEERIEAVALPVEAEEIAEAIPEEEEIALLPDGAIVPLVTVPPVEAEEIAEAIPEEEEIALLPDEAIVPPVTTPPVGALSTLPAVKDAEVLTDRAIDMVDGDQEQEAESVKLLPEQEEIITPQRPGLVISPDVVPEGKESIALFPFDNFSENKEALKRIIPLFKSRLRERGFYIVEEEAIRQYLCTKRVRFTGYVTKELASGIRERFGTNTVLTGNVFLFFGKDNPQIGLMSRLIDASTGRILWTDYVSLSGSDFTSILDLGRIRSMDKLIPRALDGLLASFTSLRPWTGQDSSVKVAVIPFYNKTSFNKAGIIATHLFIVELFKHKLFEPVEYGDVRNILVDLRIRKRGVVDYKKARDMSARLGVDKILLGTVDHFSSGVERAVAPEVSISARLLDTGINKIIWYNTYHVSGEKEIIAFDWAEMNAVDKVAYGAVSELVKKMGFETGLH